MKTKEKIKKALQYNEVTYTTLAFNFFVDYCSLQAHSNNHLQLMLTSNKLYNWFMREFSHREKAFLHFAKPFIGKYPVADLRRLYHDKTAEIAFFPKPILDQILYTAKINAGKTIHYQATQFIHYNLN